VKSFATTVAIEAPAATVWALLTDAALYPDWNSTVEKIDGQIALGQKVTVRAKASPGRAFPLLVSVFEAPARMVWTGGMPLGLFSGTRTFTLAATPGGGVVFAMREGFAGLLAGLITRSIPDLQPAFDAFAVDLKRAAERAGYAGAP
jgi:uncharacterized protein YndB with AHSA1/START domain